VEREEAQRPEDDQNDCECDEHFRSFQNVNARR
jgi:hypothetical protein